MKKVKLILMLIVIITSLSCQKDEIIRENEEKILYELKDTDTECAEEAVRLVIYKITSPVSGKITCTITEINTSETSGHTFHIGSGKCSNGRIFHFTAYEETITIEWQQP